METARALLVPQADLHQELDDADSPFHSWVAATDLQLEGPDKDKDCKPGATCVSMHVSFDLCQCVFATQPGGLQGESFGLQMIDGRWLIYGHGEG